jgi:hypothetical protein
MTHPQLAVALLVDQRNGRETAVKPFRVLAFCGLYVLRVDPVDDLQVAGQDALEQVQRPGFERLGKEGVVGVRERADGDLPGISPGQAMLVREQPHKLSDCNAGMGVVELNGGALREEVQIAIGAQMPRDQVLQRG